MRKLALYVTAALKGATEGHFICIFKIAAHWKAAGKARDFKSHRLNQSS
jgi:hypothetical protein